MWVLGRNLRGRPTLMHMVDYDRPQYAICGTFIASGSRAYFSDEHTVFLVQHMMCLRCKRKVEN